MEVILIQKGCVDALNDEANMPMSMSQKEMTYMTSKAKSVIITCLGEKALREVAKKKIDVSMWF